MLLYTYQTYRNVFDRNNENTRAICKNTPVKQVSNKMSKLVGKVNRDLAEEKEIGIMSEKITRRTENLNLRHCSYM